MLLFFCGQFFVHFWTAQWWQQVGWDYKAATHDHSNELLLV